MRAQSLSRIRLFETPWTIAHQVPLSMISPDKDTGMGCHFFLQRIFLSQGSNLCILHWQADSLPLSIWEAPYRWTLTQTDWCLYKTRKGGHTQRHQDYAHKGKAMWRHSQKLAICEPGREASEETKATNIWSWTTSLQNGEKIDFCFRHSDYIILLWQPKPANTTPKAESWRVSVWFLSFFLSFLSMVYWSRKVGLPVHKLAYI